MNLIEKIKQNDFFKNAFTLTGGVAIAQILPILFYPILGRIFSVEEFGFLATLTSITSILAVMATGKYENGILITTSKEEGAQLVGLSIVISTIFLFISYLILQFLLVEPLSIWLKEPSIGAWLYICPISAFSIIIFNIYNEWCVKNKDFKALSGNKIINSGAIVLTKTLFGYTKISGHGLVIGDMIGRILSALGCFFRGWKKDGEVFRKITWRGMKQVAKRYVEFPKFTMPGQLLNTIGLQFPILLLAIFFNKTEVGYFSMAMTIIALPINVISTAIRDVFRQRANEDFKNNGRCDSIYRKVFKTSSLIAIAGLIAFIFFLPALFALFLGSNWQISGEYAQILAIPIAFSFICTSLSGIFVITEKLRASFLWQVYYVSITLIAILLGGLLFKSMITTLILFAIGRSSAYILNLILTYKYSKGDHERRR